MKQKIIKTALKHFAINGYKNTSMQDIAEELNITKPALYYHFKNKNDLYNAIFIYYFSKLKFNISSDIFKDLEHYIDTLDNFFKKESLLAKLLSKEISCKFRNLNKESVSIISKMIQALNKILKGTNINPFFIQNLIISSFTTYLNTMEIRKKITSLITCCEISSEFDLKKELILTITNYIKAKQ
ncbi:TetR/AcrR family transcriptional regulator [Lebetimonas sp. JS138]|uniref:TetR/AcrR family transcriptional regulator n=1 Tax=Lebetimonas sp. JS138 TaxID=990072 RepID=UPI000467972D|nr:TetR/AcrR family transcriptional regulator [Lebetimonas sp. JS138]